MSQVDVEPNFSRIFSFMSQKFGIIMDIKNPERFRSGPATLAGTAQKLKIRGVLLREGVPPCISDK